MMLSLSALSAAAISAELFSPSRNPCLVKLPQLNGVARYRIDPYCAAVLPQVELSPGFPAAAPSVIRKARATPPLCAAAAPAITSSVVSLPAAAAQVSVDHTRYAVIKFKHDFVCFIAPFRVSVGELVAVEGDRGENLGTVEEITTEKPDYPITQRIVRHATQKDRDHLATLRRKEAAATKACQDIAESVGLSIRVVDTEYQYDMNKLTVFFASKVPIDFRKFQRELFREFRCRIWIVNWPRKPHH